MLFKYESIMQTIERQVAQGSIKQGERLPSIKTLSAQLNCNKSTVIKAYQELEKEHIIYSIPKSGYYLAETVKESETAMNFIDFCIVNPDAKLLPAKEFNHCINRAVDLYKKDLFYYGEAQGFGPLLEELVTYFYEDQIFVEKESICITSGSQQALNLLFHMPFPNQKEAILVEEPTYHMVHRFAALHHIPLIGIERTLHGIDFNKLEQLFQEEKIKFFYTMPRLHNPLGTSYTEKEKKKIVSLAQKYNVYIVEDDFLGNLITNKKCLPLYAYDQGSHVIYVQGFSKTFMPGIRLGAVLLPKKLLSIFLEEKRNQDLNTSVLEQAAFQLFIQSGMYQRHQRKVKSEYQKKMNLVRSYMQKFDFSNLEYFVPDTGFFIWIQLHKKIPFHLLMQRLLSKNIFLEIGDFYFIDKKAPYQGIRLSIAKLTKEQLMRGIPILMGELGQMLGEEK